MNAKRGQRGAIELSFGTIFSIILIITFIAFGIYGITKFLDLQKTIQVEKFLRDFQSDIDKMWKSSQGSQTVSYALPTNIASICFREDEFENLQFTSNNIIRGKMILHIDITKTIGDEDSLCLQNTGGKVSMTLAKNFGDVLVTVTR